ncbi:Putative transcription activator [Acidilobus saccharovorans 345-15]|uniref:Putative transcription activator n=1 Tax=Acidilobus saccharovorans (strain DSM 16705 / JCM 18335 / VKM B-2471 / 345-15) TaxID=666510 RepID=D9Q0R2_ACIS3|nr:TenA family protein [Acidilobus saccharovorans]ADL18900.1 Putative transcription activator [Acidilobus saccharovorans 345-15]
MARASEVLRQSAGDLWNQYVRSRFVEMLRDGTLPRDAFRYYLIQDSKYVEEMQRAVIRAASQAPLPEAVKVLLAVFANPERGAEVHSRLFSELNIGEVEVSSTGMNLTSYAYTRHLNYYASLGWPEFLAAWAPCMWGYSEVGSYVMHSSDPLYRTWGEFYASDDYNSRVRAVLEVLDQYSVTPEMQRAFVNSVRFEISFWESALRKDPTVY